MLLTETVKVKLTSRNRDWYISKGYIFDKNEKEIEVNTMDLTEGSHCRIELLCDYCKKNKITRTFKDHITILKKQYVQKDCCVYCKGEKQEDITIYKNEHSLIQKGDKGYYSSKENRLKELDNYIKKHRNLDKLYSNDEGFYIWLNFNKHNHSINEALQELGYNNLEYHKEERIFFRKRGFFDDFSNLEKEIKEFIKENNRFPTVDEFYNSLKISNKIINKNGGIYELKRKMNYNDKSDLVDSNGWHNLSTYEYIVAEFLYNYGIPYKREQKPFPKEEGKYRSDFMFELENNEKIYCEVWGYYKNENSHYCDIKKKKIELYNKYNIKLISLEKNVFWGSGESIKNNLFQIFQPYLKLKYKEIENEKIIPLNILKDEEILKEIMIYSMDNKTLPTIKTLKENNKYRYYNEIVKRYDNYENFANKYNLEINQHGKNYWTKEKLYNAFIILLNKGECINKKNLSKIQVNFDGIKNLNSLLEEKLEFFNSDLTGISLPKDEIKWLENVTNNKGTNIKNKVTLEQQIQAREILNKLNIKNAS